MHALPLLLSLFAVDFVGCATPGPSFVGITQISARHGLRNGLAAVAGLMVACWVYCAIVLSGLTVLFQLVPWLYGALKLAGGLYLIWIGVHLLRGKTGASGIVAGIAETPTLRQSFRKGLLVGLTNPKAMVYFASIFTLFLHPDDPAWFAAAAVGIVTFDVIVWFGFVGLMFSRPPVRRAYDRMQAFIERAAGAVMMAFGARLVLVRD